MPFTPMSPLAGYGQDQQPPQEGDIDPETGLPFSRADIEAMLGTYGDQLALGNLEGQQAQADALRNAQLHDERSNGRVTTAANPLELVGTIAQQYAGKRMNDRIDRKGGKLRGTIGENVKKYGKGLLGGDGSKPTSVPPSLAPPKAGMPQKLKIPEVY